jgi:hypothetical protein
MRARVSLLATLVLSVVAIALPASAAAQPRQEGLVNVNVSDNVVQVPIGIAANICGVGVGVLVSEIDTGPVTCTTTAVSDAVSVDSGGGGDARQRGLVNVNVEDNTLQVPLTVAANVCGVGVGILAQDIDTGPVECDARSRGRARA